MPTYYVYAPFSGKAKARDCYTNAISCGSGDCCQRTAPSTCCINSISTCEDCCACGKHIAGAGLCRAADIFSTKGSTGTEQVKLWVSPNILSIKTKHVGFCACTPPTGFEWVNWGVTVELYCGTGGGGTMVGKILYGHLQTRAVLNNHIYPDATHPSINGLLIGTLGPNWCNCNSCSGGVCNCNSCGCSCYPTNTNHHVHMGRSLGTSGVTRAWACNTDVTNGYWIFKWSPNCAS
jgi:hypothetical protein